MKSILARCFLFICLVSSGCTPGELSRPAPTSSITKTLSLLSNETPIPVATLRLSPSSTNSPAVETTSPSPPPLSSAILTPLEVVAEYPILEHYFDIVSDMTHELVASGNCLLDCVKHVWTPDSANLTYTGSRHVVIMIMKANTPQQAHELVDTTRQTFTETDDLSDRSSLAFLPDNTWSAYYFPRSEFVLIYSYGPVLLIMVSQPDRGFDDYAGEFDLIALLGKLQMDKLRSSGYIP